MKSNFLVTIEKTGVEDIGTRSKPTLSIWSRKPQTLKALDSMEETPATSAGKSWSRQRAYEYAVYQEISWVSRPTGITYT
jgi:hypothetical protein